MFFFKKKLNIRFLFKNWFFDPCSLNFRSFFNENPWRWRRRKILPLIFHYKINIQKKTWFFSKKFKKSDFYFKNQFLPNPVGGGMGPFSGGLGPRAAIFPLPPPLYLDPSQGPPRVQSWGGQLWGTRQKSLRKPRGPYFPLYFRLAGRQGVRLWGGSKCISWTCRRKKRTKRKKNNYMRWSRWEPHQG